MKKVTRLMRKEDSGEMSGSGGGGSSDEISDEQFEDLLSSIENGELTENLMNLKKKKKLRSMRTRTYLLHNNKTIGKNKKQKKFMDGEVQKKNVTKRRVSWKLSSQVVWDMLRLVKDLPIGMVKK